MARLHIFIDGSWFYKVCDSSGVLARDTVYPQHFKIDFEKLKQMILKHVSTYNPLCNEIGDCFNVTSIFTLPSDFDTWVGRSVNSIVINQGNIDRTREEVKNREEFSDSAILAGFDTHAVLRVNFKDWMVEKLVNRRYQEKQVDTTVVALLVKYAITNPNDYFAIIAGDADILPAINIAYPEFTNNMCLVTTHPDEMDAAHRQTSFSYTQYQFRIPNLYLQQHVQDIMEGPYVNKCVCCRKYFTTLRPISPTRQPHCKVCRP